VAAPASTLPLLAPPPAFAHFTYLFSLDALAVRLEIVLVREVIWKVGEVSEGRKQSKRWQRGCRCTPCSALVIWFYSAIPLT